MTKTGLASDFIYQFMQCGAGTHFWWCIYTIPFVALQPVFRDLDCMGFITEAIKYCVDLLIILMVLLASFLFKSFGEFLTTRYRVAIGMHTPKVSIKPYFNAGIWPTDADIFIMCVLDDRIKLYNFISIENDPISIQMWTSERVTSETVLQ